MIIFQEWEEEIFNRTVAKTEVINNFKEEFIMKTNEILKKCNILKDCLKAEMEKIVPQTYDSIIRTEKKHPEWCAINKKNYEIARNSYHYFTEIADYAKELQHNKKYVNIITEAKEILGEGLLKTNKAMLLGEYMQLLEAVEGDFGFCEYFDGIPCVKIKYEIQEHTIQ